MNRPLTSLIALAAAGVLASAPMMAGAQVGAPQGLNSGGASEQAQPDKPMTNKAGQPSSMGEAPNTENRPAQPGAQGGARVGPEDGVGGSNGAGVNGTRGGASTMNGETTGPAAAPGQGTRSQQENAGQGGQNGASPGSTQGQGSTTDRDMRQQHGERNGPGSTMNGNGPTAPSTSGQAASEPLMNDQDRSGSLGNR